MYAILTSTDNPKRTPTLHATAEGAFDDFRVFCATALGWSRTTKATGEEMLQLWQNKFGGTARLAHFIERPSGYYGALEKQVTEALFDAKKDASESLRKLRELIEKGRGSH